MCSVIGQMILSLLFLIISVVLLFSQSFILCNEFDGRLVDVRKWWTLADNYETATTGIIAAFQIIHISAAYNLGSTYRQGFLKNRAFLAMYGLFFAMLAFILLADPNPLGCIFRIKCVFAFSYISVAVRVRRWIILVMDSHCLACLRYTLRDLNTMSFRFTSDGCCLH
jgi:hypothetical protein